MPIEIKELIIKATVAQGESHGKGAAGSGSVDKAAIIAECIEQVLEILQEQNER